MKKNISFPALGQNKTEVIENNKDVAAQNEAAVKKTTRKFDQLFVRFLDTHEKEHNGEQIIMKLVTRLDNRLKFTKGLCKHNIKLDAIQNAKDRGEYEKYINETLIKEARKEANCVYNTMTEFLYRSDITEKEIEVYFAEIRFFMNWFERTYSELKKAA